MKLNALLIFGQFVWRLIYQMREKNVELQDLEIQPEMIIILQFWMKEYFQLKIIPIATRSVSKLYNQAFPAHRWWLLRKSSYSFPNFPQIQQKWPWNIRLKHESKQILKRNLLRFAQSILLHTFDSQKWNI